MSPGAIAGTTTPGLYTRTGVSGAPGGVSAGLGAWFDASNAASITSSGGLVSQLNDLSGRNRHLIASTTARPTTGVAAMNGLNALRFDGTANVLRNITMAGSVVNTGTWIAVVRPSSVSPVLNGRIWCMQHNGHVEWLDGDSISAMNRNGSAAGVSSYYGGSEKAVSAVANDSVHVVVQRRNGDSMASWCDGVAGGADTALGTATFAFDYMSVGGAVDGSGVPAGNYWKGDIAELIWYETALSTTDRQAVENYLLAKWCPVPVRIAGLGAWYDFSRAATRTVVGSLIDTLADLSGNNFGVVKVDALGPTVATAAIGGLTAGLFDPVMVNGLHNASISVAAGNGGTWFAVIKPTMNGSNERVLTFNGPSGGGLDDFNGTDKIAAILRTDVQNRFGSYYNGVARGDVAVTNNAAHVITTQRNGDGHTAWCDGASGSPATGLGTANFAFNRLVIGSYFGGGGFGAFYNGYIGEVLWYNAVLSSTDRQAIEAYLKAKWGTP